MRIYDIGGVYLVTFIHLRAPYMIFGYLLYLGSPFLESFLGFLNFQNKFVMIMCDLGGGVLFSEIYLFESSLYDFWILVILGVLF